ncbi:unnamed protein product [Didymodactylos carnosus]|uniref:Uncharacterized protein n=1 Tax=Didymodactylos carnosus TaxID=1234261 RepID=A0A8S2S9S9_9BILA|nr:unnamed protein product [Didymodactylos carnosus]
MLRHLLTSKQITQKQYELLKPTPEDCELPHLYYNPKDHKIGESLRPIVSGMKRPQRYRPFQHNKGKFVRRTYAEVLARQEQPPLLMHINPYDILYEDPAPEPEYYEEYQQPQKVRQKNNRPQEQRRKQQPIAANDYFPANTIIETDDLSPINGHHEQPPQETPVGQAQASRILRPIHIILSSSMASRIRTLQLYNRNNHVRIKSISGHTIYKYQVEISSGQYRRRLTPELSWSSTNGAYISPIFRETCPGTPKTKPN